MNINQFIYFKYHSLQPCLRCMIDGWYEALNENEIIAACFLDISKWFDTINYDILIQTFKYYGVNGNELKWFMNYMTNRSHVVHCHGDTSKRVM